MALAPVGRVVIGFAESLAAIESAWCLRDAGYEVVAFARSGHRPALASVRGVRIVPVPAPEDDAAATITALRDLLDTERPLALLPLDDQTLHLLSPHLDMVVVAGATGAQARLALDKREQLDLAEKAGLLVPPTGDADGPPSGPGPWIVKPALATVERDGRLSRPAGAIATDPADVTRIAARLDTPVLVQPLLDGVGEGIFGYAAGAELFGLSAHRRVRMMNPRGSGSSACVSIPVDPELIAPTRRFLADAGWHGIFMLELLRDAAGRPWFMELNGRAWGSMALARHRGLPYPLWAILGSTDRDWRPTPPPDTPHLLCRHLGREIVHLLAVLRGGRGADAGRWPSRTGTLAALLRPHRGTRWYHARRGELRVLARDTWATVAGQVRR